MNHFRATFLGFLTVAGLLSYCVPVEDPTEVVIDTVMVPPPPSPGEALPPRRETVAEIEALPAPIAAPKEPLAPVGDDEGAGGSGDPSKDAPPVQVVVQTAPTWELLSKLVRDHGFQLEIVGNRPGSAEEEALGRADLHSFLVEPMTLASSRLALPVEARLIPRWLQQKTRSAGILNPTFLLSFSPALNSEVAQILEAPETTSPLGGTLEIALAPGKDPPYRLAGRNLRLPHR